MCIRINAGIWSTENHRICRILPIGNSKVTSIIQKLNSLHTWCGQCPIAYSLHSQYPRFLPCCKGSASEAYGGIWSTNRFVTNIRSKSSDAGGAGSQSFTSSKPHIQWRYVVPDEYVLYSSVLFHGNVGKLFDYFRLQKGMLKLYLHGRTCSIVSWLPCSIRKWVRPW